MKIALVIILILIALGVFWFVVRGPSGKKVVIPNETTSSVIDSEEKQAQKMLEKITVTMTTNKGDIVLELYPSIAPNTVANFIDLSQQDFYNGIKFHRVISDFMIQGGDPLSKDNDPSNDGTGGPGYTFEDEINPKALGISDQEIAQLQLAGYKYNFELNSIPVKVGTIAMANAGPNTNGSQFFIVTQKDQSHLNGRHTVFGRVTEGMNVVRSIQQGDVIIGIKISP